MQTNDPLDIAITLLGPDDSRNGRLVEQLARLVNEVYRSAESGLWRDSATRTTTDELAELIATGQIATATRGGRLVGSVQVHDVADYTSEFSMLVADPAHRGTGVGRALVSFAERRSRDDGRRAIQLELLDPRTWRHPSKEFLKAWYGRRGYRTVRTTTLDEAHPHLAHLLATPADLHVYEKPLQTRRDTATSRPGHEPEEDGDE